MTTNDTEKLCPVMSKGLDEVFCCEQKCAWWDKRFDKCSIIIDGYLKSFDRAYKESRE